MKKKTGKRSVKKRINIWYTVLMTLLGLIMGIALTFSQNYISVLNIQKDLISRVEKNADEVDYENGVLDVDNDFVFNLQGALSLVLTEDGRVLAGSYSLDGVNIPAKEFPDPEESGKVLKITVDDRDGYIFDKRVHFNSIEFAIDGNTGEIIDWSSEAVNWEPVPVELSSNPEGKNKISSEEAFEKALLFTSLDRDECKVIGVESDDFHGIPLIVLNVLCEDSLFDDIIIRGIATKDSASSFTKGFSALLALFIPIYIGIAVFIGFLISKRAFKSVDDLSETLSSVRTLEDTKTAGKVSSDYVEFERLTDSFNRMLERLNGSFEAEKEFTGNASHELKTPLSVILAQCEIILENDALDEESKGAVRSIQRQSQSMNKLICDMLMFARIEQGKEHFDFSQNDFSELVEAVCDDLRIVSDKHIYTDIKESVTMNMDVSLMTRLIYNLLSNADKYGKEGGNIWVSVCEKKDVIVLSVKDDGAGIPAEDREKIFSKFYRVEKSRDRSDGSSGLGLAFVEEICRLHKGRITVESDTGIGSEFIVEFKK